IGIQEGASAPVDSVLAIVGPAGTDVSGILSGGAKPKAKSEGKKEETTENIKELNTEKETSPSVTNNSNRIFASPLAKKIAQDKGIDLSQVKGTGENGRIVKSDVENFTPTAKATTETKTEAVKATAQVFVPAGEIRVEEVKNSQMRKTIARRLAESKITAPHYYLTVELNIDNAMDARKTNNTLPNTIVTFNE